MAEASRQLVLDSVKSSYKTGDYSDLIITCGNDIYNVHKMIVCARAEFFSRAVKFGGKESNDGKINLSDDEPATVALLMQYLYEGEYNPPLRACHVAAKGTANIDMSQREIVRTASTDLATGYRFNYAFPHTCSACQYTGFSEYLCPHHICGKNCTYNCTKFICEKCTHIKVDGSADQLLLHSKMYELADKYNVKGLKDLAKVKFERASTAFWNDDAFATAAHHVFSTTMEEDKGLRDVVSSTISSHMELIRKPEIQVLMTEFNALALGILLKKADEHGWGLK